MNRIKTFFPKGKVKIQSLPIIVPPSAKPKKGPKRILLEKGELAEIYNSPQPIRHIAYVEFLKGRARGGHYHHRQGFFYIIRGEMELEMVDVTTGAREKTKIKEGDFISFSPKIAHIIKPIKSGHAIEFSISHFKPEDTIKYEFKSN